MSRLFIDRPIFAWVIAIIIMMMGAGAIVSLPVAQYPDVAPTQINVRASYPGASAETLENSVTQVLERQLTGIDGLLYFSSSSTARGQVSINATFDKAVDADIAQVQVNNRVQQAVARLPAQVQQQGVTVTKSSPDFLMIVGVYDETDKSTNFDVSDWLTSNLQDDLSRTDGVGDVNVFGAPYAMRIWLDPQKLSSFQLMPSDVISAITAQNTEIAAGEVGGMPQPQGQMINATVTAQSRMQTPEQFRNIIVKSDPSGARVLLGDVARVELGAENYSVRTRVNGHPGAGMGIFLEPGANALRTAELVKAKVEAIAPNMPAGYNYAYANDTTNFIKLSIEEVVKTLLEAIVLVVIVMFVFLQSWRATLIPFVAVPVVLLGTFAILYMLGFSINTMTLFGLVLATGLLVDDAIVVVENVERLMHENPGMSPREATIQSMSQIQTALVAIALILSAVFLPMIFFGGSSGVIYRQFAATIVSAMVLSVFVALTLSPAIAANLLKPTHAGVDETWFGRKAPRAAHIVEKARNKFNSGFDRLVNWYVGTVGKAVDRKWLFLAVYAAICALLIFLFWRLPTGFLPSEDQGAAQVQFRLPSGATMTRTAQVQETVESYFLRGPEKDNVRTYFTVAGGGQGAAGQNSGQAFINLADYDKRKGEENSAPAIVERASAAFRGLRDAQVFTLVPGAIRGLGQSGGFQVQLQNTGGLSPQEFQAVRDKFLAEASGDPRLTSVRPSELPDVASLKVDIDQQRLAALGLSPNDVNNTLSSAWGGRYVNDFIDRGRVKRVYVQSDAQYRAAPSDIDQWFVRNNRGEMVPFSSFARTEWTTTPTSVARFGGYPAYEIQGQGADGVSSGEAMDIVEEKASKYPGVAVAWSGQSYQERQSSGQAPLLYAVSLIVIFLCLAALYESWSIPVAVLLVIPLGLVGSILAVTLRGLENDVYLQVGLITTMGLSAKNAILMVEFAERAERQGKGVLESAIEAARIRLRPILMTSFAFIFGVLPLALATGAGANSRLAIGTAVIGGMLTATILAVFYIPLFFVLVRRGVRDGAKYVRERFRQRRPAQA
ncbi:multidrug efflux RND transporter permease subunit [Sphingomonas lutea]|uniref:Efflux pump membrane transporter n=1 Tax=Sphingomonas lutea TaxID=1045317 RepID=A0A7G9SEY3_9SPHN|nr:efflux RND transporter permease subunit [Sphingomonas lutea]QNN66408.1 multidrug efflux RND transporter permease subunit [Sphingomonas lutea]